MPVVFTKKYIEFMQLKICIFWKNSISAFNQSQSLPHRITTQTANMNWVLVLTCCLTFGSAVLNLLSVCLPYWLYTERPNLAYQGLWWRCEPSQLYGTGERIKCELILLPPGLWLLDHFYKAPKGKSKVNGKLWHLITTESENITNLIYYGRLKIKFCISLQKLFKKNNKKQSLREHKEISLLSCYLRCFINMGYHESETQKFPYICFFPCITRPLCYISHKCYGVIDSSFSYFHLNIRCVITFLVWHVNK